MKELREEKFAGERALFGARRYKISDSIFCDGESPLKESADIELEGCIFKWKYPLWYSRDVKMENCTLLDSARSGIWYTHGISIRSCTIEAPKTFRRSSGIVLEKVNLPHAQETMWSCRDVRLVDVTLTGDYFAMNSENIKAENLVISGNYAFDGARNVEVRNSRLISKDAFWNCDGVTVYDSVIIGEYLGWNSKNVTFVNCTVESNQGMCYMDGVKMVGCKLVNTDLAFEYSDCDAEILSSVLSVKNPLGGRISAESIDEIIIDGNSRGCAEITERKKS